MRRVLTASLMILTLVFMAGTAFADDDDPAKIRQEIDKMTSESLARLYKESPSAKGAIQSAYGYSVFDNFGLKILVFGSGKGAGVAVENKSGKRTYMKMVELQAGLGMGGKSFTVVMVFDNKQVFDSFVNSGWEFGGQATAAAKHEDDGGAMQGATNVAPGIWMYQMTDSGLEAAITAKGTKYYKDDDLN